jgi:opacity protein-like surface antigen
MKTKLLVAALALAAPFAASAEIPYSYVDFAALSVDAGGPGGSESGFAFEGSFKLDESWYGFAAYGDVDQSSSLSVGLGWHAPVSDAADFYADAGFVNADSGAASDSGFQVGAGLRGMPTDTLELTAGLQYVDIGSQGETGFGVGAVFYVNDQFGVGASWATIDEVDTLAVGIRVTF